MYRSFQITVYRNEVKKVLCKKCAHNMEDAERMFADWAWMWLVDRERGLGSENEKLINKINEGELGNYFYYGLDKYAIEAGE